MKITKKLIPILLSLIFVISAFMTVSALAATSSTVEQDGLVATLTCDKTEYLADEKVSVTLNVKNNNSYSVGGVETEIILPDGIKTASGDLKKTAFTLNANESRDEIVTLAKITEKSVISDSPQTGDNSHIGLYAVIMLLSGGVLIIIGIKEKWFGKKGVMSLILCFAMGGAVLSPLAVNAAGTSKSLSVENTIKYDGKDVTIKANISYLYEKHNKVTFNGTDTYYAVGDTVEITAPEPEEGKHFDGWTVVKGDITIAEPNKSSITFVMPDGEVELKANYAPNTYTITVTSGENGAISPAGEVNVEYEQSQTFTITPNMGYHIANVEVDGVSKGAITSYTFENVKETHTIKATFAIDTFTITATAGANGTITETATVNYGDSKTFTITPNAHYHIADVKVDGTSVGAKTSYEFKNVTADHKIEVSFAIDTFAIEVTSGENGKVSPAGEVSVNYGENQTFTITPNTGYHIVDVEVDDVSKGAITSYTFENVKEIHTIKATFAIDTFTITATAGANGTITETATVNYGESKIYTITPDTGYHILDVKIDGDSKGAITSYEFTNVTASHTIDVTFAIDTFPIIATSGDNGAISPFGEVYVEYNQNKTFTITPNTGYHIENVKVDGVFKGPVPSYTFGNVKENHRIEATFAIDTFTITTKTNDGGSITGNTTVNYNDNATFTVTPNAGYGVVDVKVDGTSIGAKTSYEFKDVVKNHTIEVVFGVTTEESFRNAISEGGVIYLASDLELNSSLYVSNEVTIFGQGHNLSINGGAPGNNLQKLECYTGTKLKLNDLSLNRLSILQSCTVEIEACTIDFLYCDIDCNSPLTIKSGIFKNVSFNETNKNWLSNNMGKFYGGTFYANPKDCVNLETHQIIQIKDANGVDIWVVTEK